MRQHSFAKKCLGKLEMFLSGSQLGALKVGENSQQRRCRSSSGVYVVVEPISIGGGGVFIGIFQLPPRSLKKEGKCIEVRIGPYGQVLGKWSMKEKSYDWDLIKNWFSSFARGG